MKVLVLGCRVSLRSVDAFPWDAVPGTLNLGDYDRIVIDLTLLGDDEGPKGAQAAGFPRWSQMAQFLSAPNSELIIIGGKVQHWLSGPEAWLPLFPRLKQENGTEIRNVDRGFEYYFRHVRAWQFYMEEELVVGRVSGQSFGHHIRPRVSHLDIDQRSLATTKSGHPIGVELFYRFLDNSHGLIRTSGPVIWLPPPTEIESTAAIALILRERFGVVSDTQPPDWVSSFTLPKQAQEAEVVRRIESQIDQLNLEREEALQRLSAEADYQRLLYEQGEALEPVVRSALRELGAQVIEPAKRGREDGRAISPQGQLGMLEIKARSGPLKIDDIRQLRQWVDDAGLEEDWHSKGLLVVNLRVESPPTERQELFPANCVAAAERFQQCLLTTTQLFYAICAKQCGEYDEVSFWRTVFDTNGVCQVPDLTRLE